MDAINAIYLVVWEFALADLHGRRLYSLRNV